MVLLPLPASNELSERYMVRELTQWCVLRRLGFQIGWKAMLVSVVLYQSNDLGRG